MALTLAWGVACPVRAQKAEQATAATLTAQAATQGKQTFKRKSGESLTFEEIAKLPDSTLAQIVDEMTEEDVNKYVQWQLRQAAATRAETAEIAKRTAAIEADNAEREKRIAEKSKQLAVKYEQHVGNMERGAGGEKKFSSRSWHKILCPMP